jgi:phosphatidylglycerol:prolipoprotein diacylglycerol transferase
VLDCNLPSCLKIGLNPVLADAGPVKLYWYGLMIALGFIVAIRLGMREAERRGFDPDQLLSAVLLASLLGLVGSRLYFIVSTQPKYYFSPDHIGEALSLWQGGLAFYGGIAGALLGAYIYCSRYGLPALQVLDIGALVAPLGQAIGRLGNLLNGDVGGYFTRGWGIEYTNRNNLLIPVDRVGRTLQPVPVYDVLFNLVLFAALWTMSRRPGLRPGQLTGLYLAGYGIGQLFIYAFRVEPIVLIGLKQGQLAALVLVAAGSALYLWAAGQAPVTAPTPPAASLPPSEAEAASA